jgi:hypothetical protein
MNKQLHIIIHLLPREIDEFDRMVNTLTRGSYFMEEGTEIIMDVTLNLSDRLTDWENSTIPYGYFVNKFDRILDKLTWATVIRDINITDKCLGINDKRRNSIREHNPTHFMYLDPDLHFSQYALPYTIQAMNVLEGEYILSGQLLKLWDSSWDIISSPKYKDAVGKPWLSVDPYSLEQRTKLEEISIYQTPHVKFGGGWFNIFTSKTLKFVDIPDSLGPYGLDDTFVMHGLNLLKIKQYVLSGMLVMENRRYRYNPYEGLIADRTDDPTYKQHMAKNSAVSYQEEIDKLIKRIT